MAGAFSIRYRVGAAAAVVLASVLVLIAGLVSADPAAARNASVRDDFRQTLAASDRQAFDDYIAAQIFHAAAMDAYWAQVEKKRAQRRAKKARDRALTKDDYVDTPPPSYAGPKLSRPLAARWEKFQQDREQKAPPAERDELPTVADFLENARRHYGFVPDRVPESVFKERYAREALTLGLTPEQVVKVYALETSGLGTADMQAGIHPIRKTGKPISTAIGYAQLLAANTINELSKHGTEFVARMRRMAQREQPGSARRDSLSKRADALERMVRRARAVPHVWSRHVAYSKTERGRGMHAVNLDGDIGPWLQVIKLKGLRDYAEKAGRSRLDGAEIELMNLAGPGTGLEMMAPAGRDMPTTNFFSRAAYYRNTIVRGKSSSELLQALEIRMQENMKNEGAVEFSAIFRRLDEARRGRR